MTEQEKDLKTKRKLEQRKLFSLVESVRSMLRRNYTVMFCDLGFRMTEERRRQMMAETEVEAVDFVLTLQTLLLYMTEEERCDYLDGLKHIVTG
jgi:hypothetical protein